MGVVGKREIVLPLAGIEHKFLGDLACSLGTIRTELSRIPNIYWNAKEKYIPTKLDVVI
jgi:hypothetical protein